MQQWFALSDEGVEDAVYDILVFQEFLDINLTTQSVPDATTIENFRHTLEEHDLQKEIFTTIN